MSVSLCVANAVHKRLKTTVALKVARSPAEATILSADWKTYFGTRSIFTRGCAHLCARESAERFTRLRLSRHSTRLSLSFLHTTIRTYVQRVRTIRRSGIPLTKRKQSCIRASSLTTDRQHSRIYVAPKLRRCHLTWITGAADRDVIPEACRLPELSCLFLIVFAKKKKKKDISTRNRARRDRENVVSIALEKIVKK